MINYLALGDSYTIGEQVDYADNFPNQLIQLFQTNGYQAELDQLIAVTGWTTDELALAISKKQPSFDHDLVTLLIGVNNQYRGRSIEEYSWQFYSLLCQAILFAKSIPQHVIVLSIPDWGLTPFNKERDQKVTSDEIDAFNKINSEITKAMSCVYIDITKSSRDHAQDLSYLADDKLHYSAKEYKIWAQEVFQQFTKTNKAPRL